MFTFHLLVLQTLIASSLVAVILMQRSEGAGSASAVPRPG
jgi:preprotein translocase subunit SecG